MEGLLDTKSRKSNGDLEKKGEITLDMHCLPYPGII